MKNLFIILLFCLSCDSVFATNELGKRTYQIACQTCHAPQYAPAMKAPAAFDMQAWDLRFKQAKIEADNYPARFKSVLDYLVYKVKTGKGLMHHGGLCNEANVPNKNCSDEAFLEAIHYMSLH